MSQQGLKQTQTLQQKMSPQQIQMIKLIEVTGLELKDKIEQEIQENPALEEGEEQDEMSNEEMEDNSDDKELIRDDVDFEEYIDGDDIPDYKLNINNKSRDEQKESVPFSVGSTFHDYLSDQLNLRQLTDDDKKIAEFIIGNIDDDGYLRRDAESMADDIAFQTGEEIKVEKIKSLIKVVQELDPAGVGTTTLQECLMVQLKRKASTESIETARKIIGNCFEMFSKKRYDNIKKKLNIDNDALKEAIGEIVKLNPKPGASFGNLIESNVQHITPDFILDVENGEPVVTLNDNDIPPLRISKTYKEMFEDYSRNKEQNKEMKDAVMFVKQKIDSAKWFIDALKQRNNTMFLVMSTIVKLQKEFFLKGDENCLRPLILKDVAEITGLDISTISRVSNSKYIQTEFGLYPLKYFFSESMQKENGEEVSSRAIKSILKECINNEDKNNPIKDEALMEILKEKGFIIARRTVAKYREQLGIPVARLRKEI